MTSNQVALTQALETQRSNLARESETVRSNKANESLQAQRNAIEQEFKRGELSVSQYLARLKTLETANRVVNDTINMALGAPGKILGGALK